MWSDIFLLLSLFLSGSCFEIIAFDKGEHIPNLVLGVLCLTGRKIRDFLCNESVSGTAVDANLASSFPS